MMAASYHDENILAIEYRLPDATTPVEYPAIGPDAPGFRPWRERIADARNLGHWTEEDREAWLNTATCPAAEVAHANGLGAAVQETIFVTLSSGKRTETTKLRRLFPELWTLGNQCGLLEGRHGGQVQLRSPDEVERVIERIEDEALRLKRQHAALGVPR